MRPRRGGKRFDSWGRFREIAGGNFFEITADSAPVLSIIENWNP